MIKSIYTYLLFVSLMLFSCSFIYQNSNISVFESLKENVKLKTLSDNVLYDSVSLGDYLIIKPKLNNSKINDIIYQNYTKNIKERLCDTKGKIVITFTVKHYTDAFVSILKSTYVECEEMPSFSSYEEGLNLLVYNQNVYSVEAQYSEKMKEKITTALKRKLEPECFKDNEVNNYLDLFFEKGKAYINNPLHSKLCNEMVEIEIKEENINIISK